MIMVVMIMMMMMTIVFNDDDDDHQHPFFYMQKLVCIKNIKSTNRDGVHKIALFACAIRIFFF